MGRKLTASFDDLLRSRYGMRGGASEPRFALNIDDLLATYYGAPPKGRNGQTARAASIVLSRRRDDGEVVPQRRNEARRYSARQQSTDTSPQAEDYVAREVAKRSPTSAADISAMLECQIDLGDPLVGSQPSAEPARPAATAPPVLAGSALPQRPAPTETSGAKSVDDDFMADMQSILTGQKVFDPVQKKTVDKSALPPAGAGNGDLPAPDAKNSQAIFDRIAESMSHANTYNLGTIELANRFAEFDTMADLQKTPPRKSERAQVTTPPASPPVSSEDFINDLDAIRARRDNAQPPAAAATQQSLPGRYSQPLFDTGEHVRMGVDSYDDRLRVGKNPGVPFSYGQIIAMADLYESVDQMMNTDVSELTRLKALIQQSTVHYTTGGPDVSTKDWQDATGGRYLKLAADNYEHFSPVSVTGMGKGLGTQGDNKSAWERHHQRAIEEAQKMQIGQNTSVFLEYPLIINAFGDHYLTDAFASGHLINKEAMIDRFKSNFLNKGGLSGAGKKFFLAVAMKAFRGDIAKKFGVLETANYPVCALGWCFMWHPNIDSVNMFAELLTHAAEEQPDKVANFAVKALHDYLNKSGIEVVNDAGDASWLLKGDVNLDATTLAIAKRAVQQSVDNINDPAILASNLNFGGFFAKVWKHVPKLTDKSRQTIASLVKTYTSPDSGVLVDAAATVIHDEVDGLIQTLLDEGKLKAA